jgi:hypothetical protein
MMRRRLALLIIGATALAVMGLGMTIAVDARQDVLNSVRAVTARYNSVVQAKKAGYGPFYRCTEQPGVGTMGQHFVNGDLAADPAIDPLAPEALVYEPRADGSYKLVALEWVKIGPEEATAPRVLGQPMKYIDGNNRYGITPGFYELHYWLYKPNPAGTFADWNPTVSCRGTGDNGG